MMSRLPTAVVVLVAWSVVLFGAVYPAAYWPMFIGASVIGAWTAVSERAWRDPRLLKLGLGLLACALVGVLQAIPLPSALVDLLSPSSRSFFDRLIVGYVPPAARPLSLQPADTLIVVAEILALGVFTIGLARAMRHIRIDSMLRHLMFLAVGVAVVGVLQALLAGDPPTVYGFWVPREGGNPFGPFINRNHFAGWLTMLLPLFLAHGWVLIEKEGSPWTRGQGLAHWLSTPSGNRIAATFACAAFLALALVLTGSRSGIVSLAVVLGVLGLFLGPRLEGKAAYVAVAAIVGFFASAVLWAGLPVIVARVAQGPADMAGRTTVWADTAAVIEDFPLVGTGLGAYDRAMLLYQTASREAAYAEAHNDYLQIVAEMGIAGAAVVALTVFFFVRAAESRLLHVHDDPSISRWIRRGAVAGMIGMAVQSLVEFSLQTPANALTFSLLAALVVHRPLVGSHAPRR